MDARLLRMYQFQVQLQCKYVLLAGDEIKAVLAGGGKRGADAERIFYGIQNLLNAAANVSKALWGSKGKRAADREPLRISLQVEDDSPLRDVDMRNNYEHFDQRLEEWQARSQHHNLVDMCVTWGDPSKALRGVDDLDRFREFDPSTWALTFWGQHFDLKAILSEASRIQPVAMKESLKSYGQGAT